MSQPVSFKFRLYVAENTPNSAQAIANLNDLCLRHLPGRHSIEVVNVFQEPERALADGVFMTPTLVRLSPLPVKKVVGTLSEVNTVLQALGLEAQVA